MEQYNQDIKKTTEEVTSTTTPEVFTIETATDNETMKKEKPAITKTKRIIFYLFGFLEILFAFRLILKILGANPESTFVSIIYSVTHLFLAPFIGIFRIAVSEGIETASVLEPTLLIAMVVYALLAWGIVKLIEILRNRKNEETL